MAKTLVFEAKTTQEALDQAVQETGVSLSELKFEIISPGSGGIFGLSLSKAKIKVFVPGEEKKPEAGREPDQEPAQQPAEEAADDAQPSADEAAEAASEPARNAWAQPSREVTAPPKPKRKKITVDDVIGTPRSKGKVDVDLSGRSAERGGPRSDRPSRDSSRRRESGRERAPSRPAREAPARPPETSQESRPPTNVKPVELSPLPSAGSGEYPDDPAHLERAEEILARIIAPLAEEARIETSWQDEKIYLEVSGDDSGLLIGRKGQTLDAVQFVVSKMLDKWAGQHIRIMVDTEGYRARRTEALRQTAKELADQVIISGQSAATAPLNPHDRRIIHLSLQDDDRLKTHSHGEGTYKKVVILPRSQGANRAEG